VDDFVGHSDTERLDWLEHNASKLGIKPDWQWCKVIEETEWIPLNEMSEYTDIRGKIDRLMSNAAITCDSPVHGIVGETPED